MRVVLHAVDGTGLGHLTRAALLLRALAARDAGLEALVGTNAADVAALEGIPAKVLRLPYTNIDEVRSGGDPTLRDVNLRAFLAAARAFEPDLAVFDTHVPKALLADRALRACARALLLRTLSAPAAEQFFASGLAQAFDRIVLPADFGAPPLPAAAQEPPIAARLSRVGPLVREVPSPQDRARAAERFGLGPRDVVLVAALGGGGPQVAPAKRALLSDSQAFAHALGQALEKLHGMYPGLRLFLQVGPYAEGLPAPPGVTVLRYAPELPALLARADLAICLAGYNTVWEIVRAQVPSLLCAKRSRHESQADRAGALVAAGGAAAVIEAPDPTRIAELARALLEDAPRRERLRAALSPLAVQSGFGDLAELLLALGGAALPVLPAPPPCDDACEACPVDPARRKAAPAADLDALVAQGARRVLVPCSSGRALSGEIERLTARGLTPVVETTGRMAQASPEVRTALAQGIPARLLFFGPARGLHDRASHAAESFAATVELARAAPADSAPPAWILCTTRRGELRQDTLLPIDRQAYLRVSKRAVAESSPAVAFLRRRWLPYSEIFVHTEVTALTRHRPIAVCRVTEGARLPAVPVMPLGDLPPDRAARVLERAGVKIAHAVFATCATSFLGLVRKLGVPLVVSARGHDVYRQPAPDLSGVFETASRVLARSAEMREDLVLRGCPREKIQVLPTGIDLGRFPYREPRPPRDRLEVIAVGRFAPKKGVLDALHAFAHLAKVDARARLSMYGLGHVDEDAALVALARAICEQPPLAGRVRLLPAVPQPFLAKALSQSDVFLCASRTAPDGDREGLPNAVKEAMSTGLPVVATRHAAIPSLLEGGAGVLAPEGDAEALGAALVSVARAPESWPAMTRCAHARISRDFDVRHIAIELEMIYNSICAG
jgi:glycosyltransferase involved in cell wall biosynthesis